MKDVKEAKDGRKSGELVIILVTRRTNVAAEVNLPADLFEAMGKGIDLEASAILDRFSETKSEIQLLQTESGACVAFEMNDSYLEVIRIRLK